MAVKKSGCGILGVPAAPKAGATAAQINANTRAVRRAIAKKNKMAREKAAAAAALKRNKEARKELRKKVTTRRK